MSIQIQHTMQLEAAESPGDMLPQTYHEQQRLFQAQPISIRRFLEMQARTLAEALIQGLSQIRFSIPDRVVLDPSGRITPVPTKFHEQYVGGLITSRLEPDLSKALRHHLAEMESAADAAVAAAGQLIRYTTAYTMVHDLLPSGRPVAYKAADDEEIPSIPVTRQGEEASAITAVSDVIAEESVEVDKRGELVVPYVPAAQRFYLPQWVAFDEDARLLVNSPQEAESIIASTQHFLSILHAAVSLAPYVIADEEYQRKRYGILGQLVNQGRALAIYQTKEIIATIRQRVASRDLNRGLSLSLPYFDDQDLQIKLRHLEVIPPGRIMFVPAFVVHAALKERAKVAQDTRLSASTRKYLLQELEMLGEAFLSDSELRE